LSLAGRFVAVFARPTRAWTGLEQRGQWWFPLIISVLVAVTGTALTYQRAVVPMQIAQIQRQAENGQVPASSLERTEQMMSSPQMLAVSVASVLVAVPLVTLAWALLPWLAAGFMLGHRFRYRDAFAVTAWAGMVSLPAAILTYVLAWLNQTMANLHTGFGVLLPAQDAPSKLMVGLGTFLDYGIGPFAIWYMVVLALGAAALSGALPRRVMLTLGGLWVVIWIVLSALAALFAPGA
jgi:hypothetical protein